MLAFMGMLLVSFSSSPRLVIANLAVTLTLVKVFILALFFDWEIYFTPEQTFLHQNLYTVPVTY